MSEVLFISLHFKKGSCLVPQKYVVYAQVGVKDSGNLLFFNFPVVLVCERKGKAKIIS